uniref:F-box domain-containing protein n=1 Tax=Mycena chlorophos TaxID=658473 RepID=A0ABQ0L7X7_MYCCL|nr:predicted protein [Mycena chlorophos]
MMQSRPWSNPHPAAIFGGMESKREADWEPQDIQNHERRGEQSRTDAYPVLTLPGEIITEIFQHYLPPYPDCAPLFGEGSPLCLTHICRLWREIARKSPRLWRALRLPLRFKSPDLVHLARRHLRLSGAMPLSLKFYTARDLATKLDLLLDHRDRWQYVAIALHYVPEALQGASIHAPLVTHLTLEYFLSDDKDEPPQIVAPQLHSLLCGPLTRMHSSVLAPESWATLTTLWMQFLNVAFLAQILGTTKALQHCRLGNLEYSGFLADTLPGTRAPQPVLLPFLKVLILHGSGSHEVERKIHHYLPLACPHLNTLVVDEIFIDVTGTAQPGNTLAHVCAQWKCAPRLLHIVYSAFTLEHYRAAFPEVEDLEVSEHPSGVDEAWRRWGEWDWDHA